MIANTGKLAGRTLFITGASRGIGKSIALKAAADGANIVIAAKTAEPHPKLPGTIFTAAKEIEAAGGQALPCVVDVRDEQAVAASVDKAVQQFGGIDILINNASAISLSGTLSTPMKTFDLMHQINSRGTYLVSKSCIPHLAKGTNPHILNISPPLNMNPRWFKNHVGYTMAKYGMSMCVLGMSPELQEDGIAVNALWPRTAISTAAMEMLGGKESIAQCRTSDIMSDAAYVILSRDSKTYTGNFAIDDAVLKEEGITNFDKYAVDPKGELMPDFFLDEFDEGLQQSMSKEASSEKPAAVKADESSKSDDAAIEKVFESIQGLMNEETVSKIKAVYGFTISVPSGGPLIWHLDLKNGSGAAKRGEADPAADVNFTLKSDIFHKMFTGGLAPTTAFMTGKMKIKGDISKAMKLEALMKKMKSKL